MDIKNKKVTVLGLGKSGISSARLLQKLGACVFASDANNTPFLRKTANKLRQNNIKVELGGHTDKFILDAKLIIVSPGIDTHKCPPLLKAIKQKIPVISEIELAYINCCSPIIAVTGSNGKTTVTTLIGRLFKTAGCKCHVCGNIGNPLSERVLKLKKNTAVVMEVSSFQLERIDKFRPKVSIILNVSRNHMDRHYNLQNYVQAKANIYLNQNKTDFAILNFDDPQTRRLIDKPKAKVLITSLKQVDGDGAFINNGWICVKLNNKTSRICKTNELILKQKHNLQNILTAVLVAKIFNLRDQDIKRAISTFKGLEHRIEFVRKINNISFFNDSKATSTDATIKALESMRNKTILICGGRDKGSDFKDIIPALKQRAKQIISIGEAKHKIKRALAACLPVKLSGSLQEAVHLAYRHAKPGDAVLFSPMCTSFDMFDDFEHRGEVFKEIVKSLKI